MTERWQRRREKAWKLYHFAPKVLKNQEEKASLKCPIKGTIRWPFHNLVSGQEEGTCLVSKLPACPLQCAVSWSFQQSFQSHARIYRGRKMEKFKSLLFHTYWMPSIDKTVCQSHTHTHTHNHPSSSQPHQALLDKETESGQFKSLSDGIAQLDGTQIWNQVCWIPSHAFPSIVYCFPLFFF